MATIEDVAKRAGLSRSTVSRVLNNHPYVTEEKKQIVYEAMKELGYFPNSSAQRLRRQKTDTIAVLVPRLTNPFFPFLVEGMEKVAVENGLQILICQTKQDKEKELAFLNLLTTKQVDGLIFTAIENDWQTIAPYTKSGPIVLCNEYKLDANVPIIRLNQEKGSYLGACHLIKKGHKKIAYCGGAKSELGIDREKGFRSALEQFNLLLKESWIFRDAYSIECGKDIVKQIVEMTDRPSAIFTGSDEVAAGIVKEAKSKGIKIPDELAVIGFDDQPIAELMEPPLTTIRQPTRLMGEKTMDVMMSLLMNQYYQQQVFELPIEVISRETV
ncbi:LacI family DNA-binding transcriptional regulator [Halalkalibacter krulwichiae]|uniref:HTH-type transcriptional regulator DegA n=1 Tax=Halalkalibacter krulwichiae TaxID=199441 RepID=A0A1X9MEZ8_9BACI|nr:LacI family DNA-binding transcriptional regulator [Halalkalibacter krulwichiae]ARK31224.1 HTH-type transcriptional regulator DegA [Halalkalibacter krulwichiae]